MIFVELDELVSKTDATVNLNDETILFNGVTLYTDRYSETFNNRTVDVISDDEYWYPVWVNRKVTDGTYIDALAFLDCMDYNISIQQSGQNIVITANEKTSWDHFKEDLSQIVQGFVDGFQAGATYSYLMRSGFYNPSYDYINKTISSFAPMRFFRSATQNDKNLISSLRTKYNAGWRRNVAASKGKIGDDVINLESISGEFTATDYFNKGNFQPPQPNAYHYKGPDPKLTT